MVFTTIQWALSLGVLGVILFSSIILIVTIDVKDPAYFRHGTKHPKRKTTARAETIEDTTTTELTTVLTTLPTTLPPTTVKTTTKKSNTTRTRTTRKPTTPAA